MDYFLSQIGLESKIVDVQRDYNTQLNSVMGKFSTKAAANSLRLVDESRKPHLRLNKHPTFKVN